MLTNEDHMIFRARMSVQAQAALHKADRADARLMTPRAHDWIGPDRVNKYVRCANCGKHFDIGKAKGVCSPRNFIAA